MNLSPVLRLLEQAEQVAFGGMPLPQDSSKLVIFPSSLSEQDYEKESSRVDEAFTHLEEDFYKHEEEIWTALCKYADKHQLKPRN